MIQLSLKEKFRNFFNLDDEYEYTETTVDTKEQDYVPMEHKKGKNVVSLSAIQQPSSKVVLCEPQSYEEAQEIADNLLNKRSIVINLQRVDSHQAKRIVDFLSGTVYAVNGDIQKLGLATFLCTPENVDVSGAISNSAVDEDGLEKGW